MDFSPMSNSRLPVVLDRIATIRCRLPLGNSPALNRVTCADVNGVRAGGDASVCGFEAALHAAQSATGDSAERPSRFDAIIEQAAGANDLAPDLLHAVIRAESGYDPNCRSSAGAMGLMQLMPGTARSLGVSNPYDPLQNVLGGAQYLREQLDEFGDLELSLAAYNAGPGAVNRYDGIPPYRETQTYVRRVLSYLQGDQPDAAAPSAQERTGDMP